MTEGKRDTQMTQCISGYINEHCRICNNHVTDNDFKESNFVIDVSGLIVHDRCPQNHTLEPMREEKQITTGLMEWQVTGDLLQQFKDANHKEAFYSPQFTTTDGTIWRIQFYPCGTKSPEDCSIYLECVKLNGAKPHISVNYSFNILELDWVCDSAETFKNDKHKFGKNTAFKAETITNLDALNIKCVVEETMGVGVGDDNLYFEWKVSNHLLQKWKSAPYKKVFWSPPFDAMGTGFNFGIYPNGWDKEGTAYLYIVSTDQKEIYFGYYMYIAIEGLHCHQINFLNNQIKNGAAVVCKSPFEWNDIQTLSEITIGIQIWEEGLVDNHEAGLISNMYSEKMMQMHSDYDHFQEEIQIDKYKREMASLKREKRAIEDKLKDFAMQDRRKQAQIKQLQAKLDEISMNEIKRFDASEEIMMCKDTTQKQQEFDAKMQMDENRLTEWNLDSIKIENELKSEQKEDMNETQLLLNRFMECKSVCEKQQNRMENVAMHCTKLNKIKKILKKERTQSEEMVSKTEKECQELDVKHQTLQTNRMKQQTQWMNAVQTMNKTVDEENTTNEAKCRAQNEYNVNNLEGKQWNALHAKCTTLLKQYRLFDAENEENMQQMMQMFDELWNRFMKHWLEWQ
eukprot:1119598_1